MYTGHSELPGPSRYPSISTTANSSKGGGAISGKVEERKSYNAHVSSAGKGTTPITASSKFMSSNPVRIDRTQKDVIPANETDWAPRQSELANQTLRESLFAGDSSFGGQKKAIRTEKEERSAQLQRLLPFFGNTLANFIVTILSALRRLFGFNLIVKMPAKNPLVALISYDETSDGGNQVKVRYIIPLYNTTFLTIFHGLLIYWLMLISDPADTHNHMGLGWFLQFVFLTDMTVKYIVYGYRGLGITQFSRYVDVGINLASLCAMIALQERIDGSNGDLSGVFVDPTLLAVIILQSTRIFKLFFVFNDQNIFEYILPIVLRAIFLLFSVIYFFSVFAHGFFCNALCSSCDDVVYADDDSSNWPQFSNILNFSTLPMTVFTMFEMVLLSNWSIVMDAAAKEQGWKAYAFFYIYRLVMTLVVLPILVSFMMNAFMGGVVREESSRQIMEYEEETHKKYRQALDMDFDVDVGLMEERKAFETAGLRDAEEQMGNFGSPDKGRRDPSRSPSTESATGDNQMGSKNVDSVTSMSMRDTASSLGAYSNSYSRWKHFSAMLPSLSFSGDVDSLDDPYGKRKGNYDIQSKPSSSKPSMMQIWSGGDEVSSTSPPKAPSIDTVYRGSIQSQVSYDRPSSSMDVPTGSRRPSRALEASARASFTSSNNGHRQALLDAAGYRGVDILHMAFLATQGYKPCLSERAQGIID